MEREREDHLGQRHLLQRDQEPHEHNRQIHQPVKAYVRRAPPVSAQTPASEMGATERARRSGTNSVDGTGARESADGAHHLKEPPSRAPSPGRRPPRPPLAATAVLDVAALYRPVLLGGGGREDVAEDALTRGRGRVLEASRPRGHADAAASSSSPREATRPRGREAAAGGMRSIPADRGAVRVSAPRSAPRTADTRSAPRTAERSADRGEDEDAAADRGAVRVSAEGLDGTGGRRPVRGYRGGLGMERP